MVPKKVIEETLYTLQEFGRHSFECLVLWLGTISAANAEVSAAYVPKQKPIKGEDGVGYFVAGETLFELNKTLSDQNLRLIAQIHSHPGEAYHSAADDRYAIVTAEGGFSFVVPDFGVAPAHPKSWAAYRLLGGEWKELTEKEVEEIVVVKNS